MAGLTLRQIKSTIEDAIEAAFSSVTVHRTGVQDHFDRPSFFVLMDNIQSDDHLYYRDRSFQVDVHYFPSDRNQYTLEILDTQDKLETVFGLNIPVGDRTILINNGQATVVDGVLHYPFSFKFAEDQPQAAQNPLMAELDYNG